MPSISRVVENSEQAMSIKYNNLVYDLKKRGEKVIVLSLGEAFFDIPLLSMDDLPFPAIYHYSHSRGIPELREKICEYYAKQFGVSINPEKEIIVTAGSKAAIHFSMMSVLIRVMKWSCKSQFGLAIRKMAHLCYAKPIQIPYSKSIYDYEKYFTEKTKMMIVNNPHNPRGQVLARPEIQYLIDMARANDLYILSDEAYSDFLVGEAFNSLGAFDYSKENIIVCNSVSKNFGISGWRIGYVVSNASLIDQILKVNQHIITCPATILQYYLARHFDEIIDITYPQIETVVNLRKKIAEFMDGIGISYLPGSATFYFFVSIASSKLTSEEFCTRLLIEDHISTVPGLGYGKSCDSFIRISIGVEKLEDIKYGIIKIKELIDKTS